MTEHVRFLEQLPVRAVLDGELVASGEDGKPDFQRVCERMLFNPDEIPLVSLSSGRTATGRAAGSLPATRPVAA